MEITPEMPNGVLVAVSWARNPIWCVLPDLIHFRSDSFWTAASNLETVEECIWRMNVDLSSVLSFRSQTWTPQWYEVAGVPKPKIQSLFQQTMESRYHWVQFNGVYLCRLLVSQNSSEVSSFSDTFQKSCLYSYVKRELSWRWWLCSFCC
jgi:hypothetical protein